MFELKYTDLGEGINECNIIEWYVKVGDKVEPETPLVNIENDKLRDDITSPVKGTIKKICFEEGQVVKINEVLVYIELEEDN
ncbi:hypothetical protein DH96_00085 [Candidatus Phytoplasma oryzae]|uniref:Lipoyl-binding domain-containing protein n=1 Tax=Candidatus Phytoplasma oryzae TaxID=203274 RepID=A0A328IRU7_9MOLU|nr:hypothetical protein DH96_00085 [Candidatus Phytoplasma oryzae]